EVWFRPIHSSSSSLFVFFFSFWGFSPCLSVHSCMRSSSWAVVAFDGYNNRTVLCDTNSA
ncbi:hypothetical protein MUK42_32728, partial [Musa troglodytarum]